MHATCTATGCNRFTATFTDARFAVQTRNAVADQLGHAYGTPTYTWSADKTTCTATAICAHDSNHVLTETVTAVSTPISAATCTTGGTYRMTATFANERFTAQQTNVDVGPLGHNFGTPSYVWTETGATYSVTATRVCTRDASHVETETKTGVAGTYDSSDGKFHFSVTFDSPGLGTATRLGDEVTITFHPNGTDGDELTRHIRANVATTLDPHTYVRYGCNFLGWTTTTGGVVYSDCQGVTFSSDIDLYAVWENTALYTIRYVAYSGIHGNVAGATVEYTEDVEANIYDYATLKSNPYSHPGRTFGGWTTVDMSASYPGGMAQSPLSSTPGEVVTLVAAFSWQTYSVSYHAGAGTWSVFWEASDDPDTQVHPDASMIGAFLSTLTPAGQHFDHWADASGTAYATLPSYTTHGSSQLDLYAVFVDD